MVFPATILDLRVELLLGSLGWTDISIFALQRDPITITRGSPALGATSAVPSQASMTIQNDGRFSPRNPAGPYYGLIGRNTQLRISVPDGAGGRKYRFWGEVPAWPPEWDPSGADVYSKIQAAGILRRLGQGTAPPLDSPWKRGMLRQSGSAAPVAYWPGEDGPGAQSIASGLPGGTPMRVTGAPSYGSETGFAASAPGPLISKSTWTGVIPARAADTANVVRWFMHVPAGGMPNGASVIRLHTTSSLAAVWVAYDTITPGIFAEGIDSNGGGLNTTGRIAVAGQRLLMSLELTQAGADILVTLSAMTPAGVVTTATATMVTRTLGQGTKIIVDAENAGINPIDDTAVLQISYQGTLVPLSSLATLLAGWAGETAGSRFGRLCTEQGVPYVIRGTVADTEPMGVQTSLTFLQLLAECADADQGLIYEPRAGRPAGTGGTGAFLKLADFTGTFLTGQNANFDGGIGTWLATGNSSVAGIGSPVQAGSGALQLTCTTAGNIAASHCAAANIGTQGLAVTAGDWVPVSIWFRATATPRTCQAGADFYDAGNVFNSTLFGADTIVSSIGGYTFLATHVKAPVTGHARMKVQVQGAVLNETHDIDTPAFGGPATLAQAIAQWEAASGRTLKVRREYYALSFFPGAITADLLADAAAGRKVCLTLRPAYNPVSAADLAAMTTFLDSCVAAKLNFEVALHHEPFYSGLTQAQFQAMIAYYGAAVRQRCPLVFATANSAVLHNGEGAYFVAGAFDRVATDYYADGYVSGDRLDTVAAIADGASPPLPLSLWEVNASTDAVSGQSTANGTLYFAYVKSFTDARLAAGKAGGDILLFNADSNAVQETPLTYPGDYRMALWQAQVDDTAAAAVSASLALGYRTRASLQSQAPALTLAYDQAQLSPPLLPVDDDQQTVNDVIVTRAYGGSSARAQVTAGPLSTAAPPAGVGPYQATPALNLASDSRTADFAGWLAHVGTTDELRYPSIGVDLARPQLAALFYACQDLDIGDRLAVTGLPAWLPPGGISQLVLGMSETLFGYTFVIAWNGVPESPWQTGIAGDPVYAQADTDGSTLHADLTSGATSMTADTTAGSPTAFWTLAAADMPFDVLMGGERITVTNITGAGNPQTFTITRSVNGVVKAHTALEPVALFSGTYISL